MPHKHSQAGVPVSVIIPCYCCASVLPRAVESVLQQTRLPAQIILVNDASPDNGETQRCIESLVAQYSGSFPTLQFRTLLLPENVGPGGARNAGWAVAKSPYIAFLDSDDSWSPDKLERQHQFMASNPQFKLSCHQSQYWSGAEPPPQLQPLRHTEITRQQLLISNVVPARTVMLANDATLRFPTEIRHAEDYWLWLHLVFSNARAAKLNCAMAYSYKREFGEAGLSGNLRAMHQGVLYCYQSLLHKKYINWLQFAGLVLLEHCKYAKRILTTWCFKAFKHDTSAA